MVGTSVNTQAKLDLKIQANMLRKNTVKQKRVRVIKDRLKLLSYNVQVGIESKGYSDYVTQSWRHVLPDAKRHNNLLDVAHWLSDFDIVALQEVDAGSIRTKYINQVAFLAQQGGFPHWHHQRNRHFGRFAAHSNGILAKHPVEQVVYHKLPGRIAGRGALQAMFGRGDEQLLVLSVHLALSQQARLKQINYLCDLLSGHSNFIIMGDMNCTHIQAAEEFKRHGLAVKSGNSYQPTFPRWNPKHFFDQIWVSDNLKVLNCHVMHLGVSDHLPIMMEIEIPDNLRGIKGQ